MTSQVISLTQVKTHLQWPNPTESSPHDTELTLFIGAAGDVVRYHCGDVVPELYSEQYDGGDTQIYLRSLPVLSVDSIQENAGFITYDLSDQPIEAPVISNAGDVGGGVASGIWSYSLDNPITGQITARTVGNAVRCFAPGTGNLSVVYRAGEQTVPFAVQFAALELIAHWWSNSQMRGMAMSGANLSYDASMGSMWSRDPANGIPMFFAVPYRIIEALSSHSRMPIIA